MSTPDDVLVKTEEGALARVYCTRCSEQIGQLEPIPEDATGEEAVTAQEQFDGELSVIAQEHRVLCKETAQEEVLE